MANIHQYLTGDLTTSETLLQGIYQLVDHAGGLDKLGLKGLTKAMILRCVSCSDRLMCPLIPLI